MNWIIVTKQKMTAKEAFFDAVSNKLERLFGKFNERDVFAVSGFAGKYDQNPQLLVKSTEDYPDSGSLKPLIEELKKDKVVYVVMADSANNAVQAMYMRGLIYDGERTALFAQCQIEAHTSKSRTAPIFLSLG